MDPEVVFGLRHLPRPRGEGFLFYRFANEQSIRTLVELSLYDSGHDDQSRLLFAEGIRRFIELRKLDDRTAGKLLQHYRLENMKPGTQTLFSDAVTTVVEELGLGDNAC